jgi:hypothetical protein
MVANPGGRRRSRRRRRALYQQPDLQRRSWKQQQP